MASSFPVTSQHSEHTVAQLLKLCRDRLPDNSHERFCIELFQRAILASDSDSWNAIYNQYYRLVYKWVSEASSSHELLAEITIDDLTIEAFAAFWKSYQAKQLNAASGLRSILAYLKMCVLSAVGQAHRNTKRLVMTVEWEQVAYAYSDREQKQMDEQILDEMSEKEIWAEIEQACQDEKDLIIARLGIVANLKPKKIMELHPAFFKHAREVYDRRRNLRDRLQRNPRLQSMLKIG